DYEKASRDIDPANAKESFNPLVATYPVINTSLENMFQYESEDLTDGDEINITNNWILSTEDSKESTHLNVGVSSNYQHAGVVGIRPLDQPVRHAPYIDANLRYNNVGTGAVYNAKPNTRFTLQHHTLGTVKEADSENPLNLMTEESYPQKGMPGIPLKEMLGGKPMQLDRNQAEIFSKGYPIMSNTDPIKGEYKVKDAHGELETGGQWNDYIPHIKGQTASIIVTDSKKKMVWEKRVAAKDIDYPDDKTPAVTFDEAIKMAYPDLYENGRIADLYMDEYTKKEMEKQGNPCLKELILTPKMNFTLVSRVK
ncbi:hypothetical protein COD21_31855, partial [Bacillus cereus]